MSRFAHAYALVNTASSCLIENLQVFPEVPRHVHRMLKTNLAGMQGGDDETAIFA